MFGDGKFAGELQNFRDKNNLLKDISICTQPFLKLGKINVVTDDHSALA